MTAPDIIYKLVQRFDNSRDAYRSSKYNEAQLRQEFLDPFFEALGWDVYNKNGYSPEYRDVVIEDALNIEGAAKAPDYAFKIGKERKFYVEAKKPAVDIHTNVGPAYQLRRYGWNAHLPLSILTDFEELAVYNCTKKPNPSDSAATAREKFYKYTDFTSKWDEIAAIFSREACWSGSFDRYAETSRGKKGTTEVDNAFLKDIEDWRTLLARNIALRNPQVANEQQLNYAVQMTIDRIIFLRICEDRGIEPDEQLKSMQKSGDIYRQMVELFRRADVKYNSGLFHFSVEKGETTAADTFTPGLAIDDKVLKEIIGSLYFPSPYIFKEIPVEILGKVYEQFLGRVIRLTPAHIAKVEEKPEVRKAGGVYYTPKYIVDYIVQNTVGKLLEGKTPEESAALKIVDPACGSGSFLLGAYQHLLDWHHKWYLEHDPDKWSRGKNPPIIQASGGGWSLSTAKKKQILVNNIHGVDIDAQAVEVTKLSLLLKVLEGETGQLSLGLERALPDLGRNIQCGNSLIGEDYFEGRLVVEEDERRRVNPFDWQRAFPQVFGTPSALRASPPNSGEKGGFDAVIGNPPYIRIQAMKEWAPTEVEFYKKAYKAASKGNYDIYVVFVENGLRILNQNGKLGFILPNRFFDAKYGEQLRGILSSGSYLSQIIHFGEQQIFYGASTYTCLLFLEKAGVSDFDYLKVNDLLKWRNNDGCYPIKINNDSLSENEWMFDAGKDSSLYSRLAINGTKLGSLVNMFVGMQTSADTIFLFKKYSEINSDVMRVYSQEINEWVPIESKILKPVVRSGSIKRYTSTVTAHVLFPYNVENNIAKLKSEVEIKTKYPLAWAYLMMNKKALEKREKGKFKGVGWYRYGRNQNIGLWDQSKILVPYMVTELSAYSDKDEYLYFINITTGGLGLTLKTEKLSQLYLCGLLNSKLLDYLNKVSSTGFRGGYIGVGIHNLERLPIVTVDFMDPKSVKHHDRMVMLVTRMLDLHKRTAQTPQEQESLAREIASTDREIDRLVYELYGLTVEEIKIVEGG